MIIYAFIFVAIIGAISMLISNAIPSRYPDGKCYLCRSGHAEPGETCPKCGTEQPLVN